MQGGQVGMQHQYDRSGSECSERCKNYAVDWQWPVGQATAGEGLAVAQERVDKIALVGGFFMGGKHQVCILLAQL